MNFFGIFSNKDEKTAMGQFDKNTDNSNYEIASDITASAPNTKESIQSALKTKNDINEDTIFPS